eukprot:8965414-Pyramimonas_sp.AAC.1
MRLWMEQANVEDTQWEVHGEPAGRRFLLKIKGAANYARRVVNQAMGLLKPSTPNGEWRRFYTQSVDTQRVELFVGVDKSPFQIKRELACKKTRH